MAVLVDQLEHKLMRAGLHRISVFSQGEQEDERCQSCDARVSGCHSELDTDALGNGRVFEDSVDRQLLSTQINLL